MKKEILVAFALVLVVALSGCDQTKGGGNVVPEYKNDVITVENYQVSSTTPYANSITAMSFYIKNNGEYIVSDVEVNFFNIQGFSVSDLYCEGATKNGNSCTFGDLEKGDYRKVSLTLQSPAREKIKVPTNLRVDYYVKYVYFGVRYANVPIVDDNTVKPISAFVQSQDLYTPIQVDFEPPVGSTRIENDQEIKEYWGLQGMPFQMKLNFENVGSSSTGEIMDVEIEKNNIALFLRDNLEVVSNLVCDFGGCADLNLPCSRIGGEEGQTTNILYSTKELRVPGSLVCNFRLPSSDQPEVVTTLEVQYKFNYEFLRSQVFEIQPYLS